MSSKEDGKDYYNPKDSVITEFLNSADPQKYFDDYQEMTRLKWGMDLDPEPFRKAIKRRHGVPKGAYAPDCEKTVEVSTRSGYGNIVADQKRRKAKKAIQQKKQAKDRIALTKSRTVEVYSQIDSLFVDDCFVIQQREALAADLERERVEAEKANAPSEVKPPVNMKKLERQAKRQELERNLRRKAVNKAQKKLNKEQGKLLEVAHHGVTESGCQDYDEEARYYEGCFGPFETYMPYDFFYNAANHMTAEAIVSRLRDLCSFGDPEKNLSEELIDKVQKYILPNLSGRDDILWCRAMNTFEVSVRCLILFSRSPDEATTSHICHIWSAWVSGTTYFERQLINGVTSAIMKLIFPKPAISTESDVTFESFVTVLNEARSIEVVQKIYEALYALLSSRMFNFVDRKDFAMYIGPPAKASVLEVLTKIFEVVMSLVRAGKAISAGVPWHKALLDGDPVGALVSAANETLLYENFLYTGLPVEGKKCLRQFMFEVKNHLATAESFKPIVTKSDKRYLVLVTLIQRLKMALLAANNMASNTRPVPFGLIVAGNPGVGKGRIINMMCSWWSEMKGRPYHPNQVYPKSPGSEFYE